MNKVYINAGAIVLHYFQNADKNFMPIEKFNEIVEKIHNEVYKDIDNLEDDYIFRTYCEDIERFCLYNNSFFEIVSNDTIYLKKPLTENIIKKYEIHDEIKKIEI